jgi:hypothetical protein
MATRSPAKNASKLAKKTARKTTAKTVRKTAAKTTRKAARPAKAAVKRVMRAPRLASLSYGHFAPRLHQQFLIRPESGEPIKAELISVTELGHRPTAKKGAARQSTFSIVLRGPKSDTYLPQRIYSVEHGHLGKHKIFLVPIGPDEHGMRYEAVFN